MEIIRWIFYIPVVVIAQILLPYICEKIIIFILKYFLFINLDFMGTKYSGYDTYFFDFERNIREFTIFLCTSCLAVIVSGVISGIIGHNVAPKKGRTVANVLLGIITFGIYAITCIFTWTNEHWFLCTCLIIASFIAWCLLISITSYKDRWDIDK